MTHHLAHGGDVRTGCECQDRQVHARVGLLYLQSACQQLSSETQALHPGRKSTGGQTLSGVGGTGRGNEERQRITGQAKQRAAPGPTPAPHHPKGQVTTASQEGWDRGGSRPRLTAERAGGLWTSWARLWLVSPWMTPPPQTCLQPLPKEAQDNDLHGAVAGGTWAGHPEPPWLWQVVARPAASQAWVGTREGFGWKNSLSALKQGLHRGRSVSKPFPAPRSFQDILKHSGMKILAKRGQDLSLYQNLQNSEHKMKDRCEISMVLFCFVF